MITHEPWTAGFTGTLTTLYDTANRRYTIGKPYLKVRKGDAFMLKMDSDKKTVKMIPVVTQPFA